jgi:putative PIN family toxin of toxin-antitoxin system
LRVVLDSSVLIAAAISRAGACAALLEDVLTHHELVLSEFILGEVERKLREKFGYPIREVRPLLALLRKSAEIVEPANVPLTVCRDPDDVPVLGTAVAGSAHAIVSGDRDLLVLQRYDNTQIVAPNQFWEFALRSPSK